jgi:hypothetical protein
MTYHITSVLGTHVLVQLPYSVLEQYWYSGVARTERIYPVTYREMTQQEDARIVRNRAASAWPQKLEGTVPGGDEWGECPFGQEVGRLHGPEK